MKITDLKVIRSKKPFELPEAWRPAWNMPDVKPIRTSSFSSIEVHTDEDLVGICLGGGELQPAQIERLKNDLVGADPFQVGRFWEMYMAGRSDVPVGYKYVDVALWDIIGKACKKPVYKLLGACRDRIPVYVATSQLHSLKEHAEEAVKFREEGIHAIKLRLHRQNHEDDLNVVKAVRDSVGEDMVIMVDANQNNFAPSYNYWSRQTASWMAKKLDGLDVYFLEDPLPLSDVEWIKQLANSVDMAIAGTEHASDFYRFRDFLFSGAYDIVNPDILMGNPGVGLTGLRKVAQLADSVGRQVIPHVVVNSGFRLAATLQVMASVNNCPYVEYPLEPPALTVETQQWFMKEHIIIEKDGCVKVPQLPGIGVEIDEEKVKNYL